MSNSLRTIQLCTNDPKPDLSLKNIEKYYIYPIAEAAKLLGCCTSVLKKIMRKFGIKRWPYRKIKSLDKMINEGDSEEKALAIDKKELLLGDPNINYTDLIPKSKINHFNVKISNKKKGKTHVRSYNKKCVTKKTVGLKVANKLPPLILNSQICPAEIDKIDIDSETESDCDDDNYTTTSTVPVPVPAATATATIVINNNESDSEDDDPDMLFIDETPSDDEAESSNRVNEESELDSADRIKLTLGEIGCLQSQCYFTSEQHYNF
jgi:hypothetical protein